MNSLTNWTETYTQTASTTKNTQSLSYGTGNRLTQNLTTKVVGTVSNGTNQAITLDAAGNTKNDGFRQYTYNALNQLSSLTAAGKTTQYSYDIQNRRLLKTVGTQINRYVYAEEIGEGSTALSDSSLLGEYGASATSNKEYVYLGDTPIAVVQAGNILTVQTDHLNTPRQLTDSTKKIIWNWAYSAFGENQPTSINVTTTLNLRYPGQYYDAESKLHYNINRYYDPATGRYTQSDPIGLAGGINTYTYVGGNTVKWSDPRGLDWFRSPNSSEPYSVGRDGHPLVRPGGPVSRFIEHCIPAGQTFGHIHDARVDELIDKGVPDWRANIPTMPGAYVDAVVEETKKSLGDLESNIRNLYGVPNY